MNDENRNNDNNIRSNRGDSHAVQSSATMNSRRINEIKKRFTRLRVQLDKDCRKYFEQPESRLKVSDIEFPDVVEDIQDLLLELAVTLNYLRVTYTAEELLDPKFEGLCTQISDAHMNLRNHIVSQTGRTSLTQRPEEEPGDGDIVSVSHGEDSGLSVELVDEEDATQVLWVRADVPPPPLALRLYESGSSGAPEEGNEEEAEEEEELWWEDMNVYPV